MDKDVWRTPTQINYPKIVINEELKRVIMSVQRKIGNYEFCICIEGWFDPENGMLRTTSNYHLPKQVVKTAACDPYSETVTEWRKEVHDRGMWMGWLHTHPKGVTNFSSDDENTLNRNSDFSIIMDKEGKPLKAIANVPVGRGVKWKIECELLIEQNLPDIDVSMIQTQSYSYSYQPWKQRKASDNQRKIDEEWKKENRKSKKKQRVSESEIREREGSTDIIETALDMLVDNRLSGENELQGEDEKVLKFLGYDDVDIEILRRAWEAIKDYEEELGEYNTESESESEKGSTRIPQTP